MTEKDTNLRAKWKTVQAMTDIFWKKWIKVYLSDKNKKTKKTSRLQNVRDGDLVIIAQENIERSK